MRVKVFIENEAGSSKKNIFDEKTFEYRKTVEVSAPYPYPYGFIPGTTSGDGDNLDCFVITDRQLKTGDIVEAELIGMFEQREDGEEDHKVLAVLPGEHGEITAELEEKLRTFVLSVFAHREGKTMEVGSFHGMEEAEALLEKLRDKRQE